MDARPTANQWLGIAVDSSVPWPTVDAKVSFCGREIVLRAATDATWPSVEIDFAPPMAADAAHLLLRRFLSSLVWTEGYAVREIMSFRGARRMGFGRSGPGMVGMVLNPHFRADYLPEPTDPKTQLALALYREALGVNSQPYKFLGFFKVINVLNATGRQQRDWITAALPRITEHQAKKRLQVLNRTTVDVAGYLYESGRCAVAHAFDEPVVDPDKLEDDLRLSSDLPVIRALAEHFIEHELGVRSMSTVRREHLYELDGFRRVLGPRIVAALKSGSRPEAADLPVFPNLSVRIRGHVPFPSFEDLAVESVEPIDGCVILMLRNPNGSIRIALTLYVVEERLGFDPTTDIGIRDDGSREVITAAIDHARFVSGMVANGQLEVWQTQPQELFGRCDPCIPVNIDGRRTAENLRRMISELEQELEQRTGGPQ